MIPLPIALAIVFGLMSVVSIIAGCTEARSDAPPAVTEPVPRLIPTEKGNFVCIAPGFEQSEEWRAACAPIGSWRHCVETTTTLQCADDPRRGA